jgi:hypothetical protein
MIGDLNISKTLNLQIQLNGKRNSINDDDLKFSDV